jgi:hypothetical protein
MMSENKMRYRGSKSVFLLNTVKEQRVDGSWLLNKLAIPIRSLRFTLMGLETGYQVKFLAKQLNNRTNSTLLNKLMMNPWFLTGFADAESSFVNQINKNKKGTWQVQPVFVIELHSKDLYLLKQIQTFFKGKGTIKINNTKNSTMFRVRKLEDIINIIIPHFKEYPLITNKSIDFLLWCKIIEIIRKKDHLSSSGFKEILSIRASLNWGLSEKLKLEFPEVVPIVRPSYEKIILIEPSWLAGFASGDASFTSSLSTSKNGKFAIKSIFQLSQLDRDTELLMLIRNLLETGNIYPDKGNMMRLMVQSYKDCFNFIIPFFEKYPILGDKFKHYKIWKEIVLLLKDKAQNTPEGIKKY